MLNTHPARVLNQVAVEQSAIDSPLSAKFSPVRQTTENGSFRSGRTFR